MVKRKFSEIDPNQPLSSNRSQETSMLADKTTEMERKRHRIEQQGHRQLGAKVHEKEYVEKSSPEGEYTEEALVHPEFQFSQLYDGIYDPEFIPFIPDNPEAQRELENKLRLQHQLRLNKNKERQFSPTPQGP